MMALLHRSEVTISLYFVPTIPLILSRLTNPPSDLHRLLEAFSTMTISLILAYYRPVFALKHKTLVIYFYFWFMRCFMTGEFPALDVMAITL